MVINIGGEVSPSFLFILVTFFFWKTNLNFKKDGILRSFSGLFYILIVLQTCLIPFGEADLFIQLKGLLITVSGLLNFWFYYLVYSKNQGVVKWAVLGTFLSSFVFINELALIDGTDYGFWKFNVMPRIVALCCVIYLFTCNVKPLYKLAPYIFIGVGLLGIATGARSTGLQPLLAGGLVCFLSRTTKRINLKVVKIYILVGAIVAYMAYALVYVPAVLSGEINQGNSEQLKNVENPYNPINLLMLGRGDSMVSFVAFFDKPLFGWGFGTSDPHEYYHYLQLKLSSNEDLFNPERIEFKERIPQHSVIGSYACSYGVIAFVVMCLFFIRVWKYSYYSLIIVDKYLLYRLILLFSFTWNFLFSPPSHFKVSIPMNMAIIIVFAAKAITQSKDKKVSK